MSEAQLCPDCKEETILSREGKVSICHNPKCNLGGMMFGLGFWNRIRIAPDDKDVEITNKYDTDIRDWMNPEYPKEKE